VTSLFSAEEKLHKANALLQTTIDMARVQMQASLSAYPRNILDMRLEDYLQMLSSPTIPPRKESRKTKDQSIPPAPPNKTPRIARPGETVYSARGSPIFIPQIKRPTNTVTAAVEPSDEDEENEPSFDTASDKSSSNESLSLPDEAAYTAQVIQEERNKLVSSEGFFSRSSSMYHRSSGT
jgi:hypothetical protein